MRPILNWRILQNFYIFLNRRGRVAGLFVLPQTYERLCKILHYLYFCQTYEIFLLGVKFYIICISAKRTSFFGSSQIGNKFCFS